MGGKAINPSSPPGRLSVSCLSLAVFLSLPDPTAF
jgi:hypothetical protein